MTTNLLQQLQDSLGSDYRFERELGGGAMSRVFLAEELSLGRRVVVKVLSPELGAGLSTGRFEREIQVAARLQDPRIVQLLRAGQVGDLPFYTMPYVEGESLRTRLDRGPIPLQEALGILGDVALALEYAHAQGVVHRDIKPENILLAGRTAVVADFGIAKAVTAATRSGAGTLTALGSVVGTPAYMAPEQASGDAVDFRSDLYAWGVIAYEMLAGTHPFAGHSTARALLAAHIAEAPPPLAERRPDLPPALASLVDRCMDKDPGGRPESASVLVAQLSGGPRGSVSPTSRLSTARLLSIALLVGVFIGTGAWLHRRSQVRTWARDEALPEAEHLRSADRNLAAFLVLEKARRYLPQDTDLEQAIAQHVRRVSVTSSPSGAAVAIQDYDTPDSAWYGLGTTPLESVRIPDGYFRWRIVKQGVGEFVSAPLVAKAMSFPLDSVEAAPAGMVPVPASTWLALIDFVGWVGPYRLPAFYMDRLEVTNREYQKFVDRGGYATRKFWTQPFVEDGRALGWTEAMSRFRDRTGRAGPSTWEGGHYPEGLADYPVSGISWYEAAAYAAFAGKSLPTIAQWYEAAPGMVGRYIVKVSNITRKSPAPAGSFRGVGPYGTYDMAGNVREWTLNSVVGGDRFILGGMWSSQTYLYSDPETLSPFDRSPGNGARYVRDEGPLPAGATKAITPLRRDFSKARPVSDAVFRAYRVMYAYDKTPLNAKVEGVVEDTKDWREEKVTFDAAYGGERMAAYLFLPKRVRPPYQTVVFFPSARVLDIGNSRTLGDISFFDYVVQSGRAVMYPIYQDTYERRQQHTFPGPLQTTKVTVQRSKDLERSLDYLDTRPDIATDKLAYMGVSMGAAEGVIYATLAQDRLKAVILLDGGFFLNPPPPGTDQVDFAPRLTKPVLMVNGRYDFDFSSARSQLPLFQMLGTPSADKRRVVLGTPHDVRADRPRLVKAVLAWLDKYLGRVD